MRLKNREIYFRKFPKGRVEKSESWYIKENGRHEHGDLRTKNNEGPKMWIKMLFTLYGKNCYRCL